jgi:thioredoxin 1
MVKKISNNEFSEVKSSKLAVVDFSATWCGPCKMLAPVMEDVSGELDGKVDFFNVDVDDNPDLAAMFEIQNIPAILIMRDGEKIDESVGFQPKANLLKFINTYVSSGKN